MRARDKFVHRWKADRQVGHPVILAGPAPQMIFLYGFFVKALQIFIAIGMLRAFQKVYLESVSQTYLPPPLIGHSVSSIQSKKGFNVTLSQKTKQTNQWSLHFCSV